MSKVLDIKLKENGELPQVKEVRKQFLKLCIERHPDKEGGSNEKMKELLEANRRVCEYIMKNVNTDNSDTEETQARKEFKEFNMETVNEISVTFHVPSSHISCWEEVLEEFFGDPSQDNTRTNNGKQFSTPEGFHIKIWKKSTPNRTLLVNGKDGYFDFA